MPKRQNQELREIGTSGISSHGRDEMNLAEFPITVLADRAPRGAKTLTFRAGQGELTITGSDAYGLPTALDADVIVGLVQLTKIKTDFKCPKVHFTRYELLRLLGWKNEGRNYRRIDESLQRWVGVTLHYDRCWWDNRAKKYGDATLHILESAIILDGKGRPDDDGQQGLLPLSSFTWNKVFLHSCQADNLKLLDVNVYFSLEHSASKRLYRFLDKRFYYRTNWVFDLAEIAFERVGLSRNYASNAAKIKEKLHPAVEELESIRFLEPIRREERYFKEAGCWKIRLDKHRDRITLPNAAPTNDAKPCPSPLVADLVARGVNRSRAQELAEQYPAEAIRAKMEIADWLRSKQDKRIAKNPAGWLVKAIIEDYEPPKGFESLAELQARLVEEQERDRKATTVERDRRDEVRRSVLVRHQIDAYIDRLDPDQRATFEAEALALAPEETRRTFDQPEFARYRAFFMLGLLREYVSSKTRETQSLLF